MSIIKKIFLFSIVILNCIVKDLKAQEERNGLLWFTNINEAYAQSQKTQKPIFALFTGSDWCYWCHKLENEVFDKPGFKQWAKEHVVLLELDFPRNKQLPAELQKQNGELQQFFNVQGFPTVWMFYMNKDTGTNRYNISALGSLGYPQARPGKEETAFIDNATQVMKNKK